MPLDAGFLAAAAATGLAAIPGLFSLVRWHAATGPTRAARWMLTAAFATTFIWAATAAVIVAHGRTDGPHRHAVALAGAIGVPVATLLMLASVERLPGVVDSAATRLRRRLDTTLMTPAIFLSGWIAVSTFGNHGRPIHLHPHFRIVATAPPVIATALALAFATVIVIRAVSTRAAIVFVVAGILATTAGGASIVIGTAYGILAAVLAGGAVAATGLLLLAASRALRGGFAEAPGVSPGPGWYMTGATVSLALIMIIIQVATTGSLDGIGAGAGVLTGFAIVARLGLAVIDGNRLSARLQEDEVHLRTLAFTDALTGVANRRELLRTLHDEVLGGPSCVLLALDLDGFKNINDLRGHDVGDAVLVEVAHRLRANLRPGDLAARMGGDEFAVVMWADVADATNAARRLLTTLSQPYQTDAGSVFLSASIGLAASSSAPEVAGLLRNADLALRSAKHRGKDRVEPYDPSYDEDMRRRTTVEHELRGAVARDELSLAFQPVVALPAATPVGVEALLRWTHPVLGMVGPDEFIPIAEEAGLVGQLDRWVLSEACRQLARWLDRGYDLWLAVNISVRELHLVDYVSQVRQTLRTHRVDPGRLVLEITEHTVALDLDELIGQLDELRRTGVRIALDDFGAGYSSLGQLRRLPVDILKIDRSLVGDPARESSREAAPLVDVVVRLGRRLGLQVIAEGVAEEAERAVVVGAGCKLGQGDLFGPAMPPESIDRMLADLAVNVPKPRKPRQGRTTRETPSTI